MVLISDMVNQKQVRTSNLFKAFDHIDGCVKFIFTKNILYFTCAQPISNYHLIYKFSFENLFSPNFCKPFYAFSQWPLHEMVTLCRCARVKSKTDKLKITLLLMSSNALNRSNYLNSTPHNCAWCLKCTFA